MKRRIKQNVWGNWNGYEGTRKTIEFGTDWRDAELWLADPERFFREQKEARDACPARYVGQHDSPTPNS